MRSDIKDAEALEALTKNLRDARKAVSIPLLYHQSFRGGRDNYRLGEMPWISQSEGLRWRAVVQHDRRTRYSQRQAKTARYQPIDK